MSNEIDVTDLVEMTRSTFVIMAKSYLMGLALAIPGIGPFLAWLIKTFAGYILDWVLGKLSTWVVMQAFFLNTAIRKASEAQDYVDMVNKKNSLPENVSDEEYEKAELAEIRAFTVFVSVT